MNAIQVNFFEKIGLYQLIVDILHSPNLVLWIQAFVLFITFLAITWYTIETRRLRSAQQKSNKIAIGRPLIGVYNDDSDGEKIGLVNLGNNIPLDVKIEVNIAGVVKPYETSVLFNEIFYNIGGNNDEIARIKIKYKDFYREKRYITTWKKDRNVFILPGKGGCKIKKEDTILLKK